MTAWKGLLWRAGAVLALLAILWAVFWPLPAASQGRVDAAIVFVVDRSVSMKEEERTVVDEGHAAAIQSSAVLEAVLDGRHKRIAASFVEFGAHARVKVGWTIIDGQETAQAFAGAILAPLKIDDSFDSHTLIYKGLREARDLLLSLPVAAEKYVVDVVGDGNDMASLIELERVRREIIGLGAAINGLPIIINPYDKDVVDFYEAHVIGGPAAFNLPVEAIADFPMKIRQKLVLELF